MLMVNRTTAEQSTGMNHCRLMRSVEAMVEKKKKAEEYESLNLAGKKTPQQAATQRQKPQWQ